MVDYSKWKDIEVIYFLPLSLIILIAFEVMQSQIWS